MQDRFKFRVWNKLANIMTYNFCFGNFLQQVDGMHKYDWLGVNYEPEYICFKETALKNLELMQCTGLHDKNGKLIFEGDIVKSFHLSSSMQPNIFVGKVTFNQSQLYWHIENNGAFVSFLDTDDICEVIGNIYENPELLEDK